MDFSLANLISWLLVGGLAGAVLNLFRKGKDASGKWKNFGIGLAGAVIGGFIFGLLKVDLGLGEVKVTLEGLLAAVLGSVLLLFVLWIIRKSKGKKTAA